MTRMLICLATLLAFAPAYAGPVTGAMPGPVTMRTAGFWVGSEIPVNSIHLRYWPAGSDSSRNALLVQQKGSSEPVEASVPYYIQKINLSGLQPGTTYQYHISVFSGNSKTAAWASRGTFTTQSLFQWRGTPAPDFSFLTGSCSYFNEPPFDRPGKPYGQDSSIYQTMAREKAAFMLWLGDNWYTREVDYSSTAGMWRRAIYDRTQPISSRFWSAMPHLAIWDDHDYGPNDYGKSFIFKQTSRDVFRNMWMNPTTGENNEGIYTKYTYNDVDFFMLDDRWWRSFDDLADSVGGKPNPEKTMFGAKQLEWLKDELRQSSKNPHISFRIIATGSQVLNPASPFDKLLRFPAEYDALMQFIRDEKIPGIIFLTGDRHHSEIIRVQHQGIYPLYDITASPLTSGTHSFSGPEANNPWRVLGIDKVQNYARISLSGQYKNRILKVEYMGLKGEKLGEWQVGEKELRISR